jgi:UDP-GlcNAc:undecaprenyl-phosphate GlcNAc-1-phosphate transferase
MLFLLIFLTSLVVTCFSIPEIIKVAFQKRLFDAPTEQRKVHKRIIPNFGGIAIFTSLLFTCGLLIPIQVLPEASILMSAALILFMTGLKDDVVGLAPIIKFIAQFACAFIITIVADLRISTLDGIFGIGELPLYGSVLFTVFFIVGIVNAFNLIDGIDGLAGTLGVIMSLVFSFLFYKAGAIGWAYLSIALTGALIGFLFFNVTPAKIFMGDSGSLLIGFIASLLSIKFIHIQHSTDIMVGPFKVTMGIGLVLAILIIPFFDTLRVFTLRILKNGSPFVADSNHLHHRLLFVGLTHIQATLVLAVCNGLFIIVALSVQGLSESQLVALIIGSALTINGLFSIYVHRFKKALYSVVDLPDYLYEDHEVKVKNTSDPILNLKTLKKVSKN